MKKIIVFLLFFSSMTLFAQPKATRTAIKYSESGRIKAILFSKDDKTIAIPQTYDVFFKDILKIRECDEFRTNNKVKMDAEHHTFEQFYKGIKVCDGGYTFHCDSDGVMEYAHGNYVEIPSINTVPSISPEKAKSLFAAYQKIDEKDIKGFTYDLLIKCIYGKANRRALPILVYRIVLNAESLKNKEIGYVNAHSGVVEETEPRACYAMGRFVTRHHGTRYADTELSNNSYRLYDNSRGAVIRTLNLNSLDPDLYMYSSEITDSDNEWYYTDFPFREDMGLDVHWALQRIYDSLYNSYGKNSFDNNGMGIIALVNAVIDGDADNAAWYRDLGILCFGKGQYCPRAFSSVDIVAHEFGHGITQYQINWGTNAAHLDEGLSDIWGVIKDYRWGANDSEMEVEV